VISFGCNAMQLKIVQRLEGTYCLFFSVKGYAKQETSRSWWQAEQKLLCSPEYGGDMLL
jgi:hypothetical protein